jgi:hypothetical protein
MGSYIIRVSTSLGTQLLLGLFPRHACMHASWDGHPYIRVSSFFCHFVHDPCYMYVHTLGFLLYIRVYVPSRHASWDIHTLGLGFFLTCRCVGVSALCQDKHLVFFASLTGIALLGLICDYGQEYAISGSD